MDDDPKQPVSLAVARSRTPLEGPILSFDVQEEIERLNRQNVGQSGRNSETLVKYSDFRVVLMVMRKNAKFHEHKAAGRISIEVVSGHIQMNILGRIIDLPAGHLLALDRDVLHDVEALEESAFLLTIAWPEGA